MSLSRELLIFSHPLTILILRASLTPQSFILIVPLSPLSAKGVVLEVGVLCEAQVEAVVVVGIRLPSSGSEVRLTGSITPTVQPLGCRLVTVMRR
jgi:hypothetical protein